MQTRSTPGQPTILANAPRCGAQTRSGSPCRSPAIHGRARCRMHGGKGSGAPRGNLNARKHGAFTGGMKDIARYIRITAMVVKHANRTIWLEDCARHHAALDRRIAVLRTAVMLDPGRDCPRQSLGQAARIDHLDRQNTPVDLGEQPHAPGNCVQIAGIFALAARTL